MLVSNIIYFVLAAAAVQSAALPKKAGGKNKAVITITAANVASVPAKADGCATITPQGATAQTVCAKKITAEGFSMSVKDVATKKKVKCTVKGTSGTCGTTGAGASISKLAKRGEEIEEAMEEEE